ncbi:MBL fold metallo-hydrolase [Novosphingobium album (ex Liu et al. 2023)]|uniref:MBL fold metallo-hydrolase n=1 Tax=Novosphingobium album (ex Liu et al. 2023) TaxID=3031130 RepID=A0ABT5WVV1_9SPHN|nr:MBL fold metallo-hydrolase [Novosphingobium album (ex Liu et al. 2023)]MDE8654033.1 MBL fold metallo-hydrolase [Novosphingobium album (ex Liu et al. 2023)]
MAVVERALLGKGAAPGIRSFFDEATFTATHVVHDPATRRAVIIDPVLDFDPASGRTSHASADAVIAYVEQTGLAVEWLLETHVHADHLSAASYLRERFGARVAIGAQIRRVQDVFGGLFNEGAGFRRDGSQFDHVFEDGETFTIGEIEVAVLHVPGHTPADLAYVMGDAVFAGDTIFMPDFGTARADFPGGDARQLYRSIQRLLSLPGKARLFLCHDYKAPGRDAFAWETTIARQREANIHVHDGVSEDAFVTMRVARDRTLDMPRLILPSIQVNMRAGHLPEPEANGIRYLKLPLNVL